MERRYVLRTCVLWEKLRIAGSWRFKCLSHNLFVFLLPKMHLVKEGNYPIDKKRQGQFYRASQILETIWPFWRLVRFLWLFGRHTLHHFVSWLQQVSDQRPIPVAAISTTSFASICFWCIDWNFKLSNVWILKPKQNQICGTLGAGTTLVAFSILKSIQWSNYVIHYSLKVIKSFKYKEIKKNRRIFSTFT